MLEYVVEDDNAVIVAFWDGKSKETKDMISRINKAGIQIIIRYPAGK